MKVCDFCKVEDGDADGGVTPFLLTLASSYGSDDGKSTGCDLCSACAEILLNGPRKWDALFDRIAERDDR